MDVTESLFQAIMLFGLGMGFVFSFLGLLMVTVKVMAKFMPADDPIVNKRSPRKAKVNANISKSEMNPQLITAITSAVQQYRKAETA